MRALRFLISTILIVASGSATHAADPIPLFFQADKNNIQVLPQKFEFNLVDENNIKIGDIVIEGSTFGFQIAPSTAFPGKYRARFIWPAGLLREGSLIIKDNVGKAVWTSNINRRTIRLLKTDKENNDGTRTQIAEYVVDQINPALVEDMKFFPFMNFCISQTTRSRLGAQGAD